MQKSFSDGKLVEDEQDLNGSAAVSNTQVKPQKAVKFLQTLPPPPSAAGQQIAQSEDEVSDRDLPELAPIDIQDYQRKGEITSLSSLTKISIKMTQDNNQKPQNPFLMGILEKGDPQL